VGGIIEMTVKRMKGVLNMLFNKYECRVCGKEFTLFRLTTSEAKDNLCPACKEIITGKNPLSSGEESSSCDDRFTWSGG
jgi:hypothetical protein